MPLYENGSYRRWTRIVYVIELSPEACSDPRSPCGGGCCKTPVYVGHTAQTAEERFDQHKEGYKASRWPRLYGVCVRPRLATGFGEMDTVAESLAAEAELGRTTSSGSRWIKILRVRRSLNTVAGRKGRCPRSR